MWITVYASDPVGVVGIKLEAPHTQGEGSKKATGGLQTSQLIWTIKGIYLDIF